MSSIRTRLIRISVAVTASAVGVALMGSVGAAGEVGTTRTTPIRVSAVDGPRVDGSEASRILSKNDPRGDIRRPRQDAGIDISRVQAWPHLNDRPLYLAVRISGYDFPNASSRRNVADVYLNMEHTGAKPDFRIIQYLPNDGDGLEGSFLLKSDGWKESAGTKRCDGFFVRFKPRRDIVTFFVPRTCVNAQQGRKFQVHARVWNITAYTAGGQPKRGRFDEVPNRLSGQGPRFLAGWA
jgi:hypothetical protein